MAQCKGSALEFIQDTFSPNVAVVCSHDAEMVCQKNNLTFVELIQPFCKISSEAHIRDPGNVSHTVRNLRINMRDMNQTPPQTTLVKKLLNEAVSNALPQNYDCHANSVLSVGTYDLQLSATTPWYEAYRECFLQSAYPSDHEFLKHFLACIFVVSSSHADAMDQFSKLTQQQQLQMHQQPARLPRWFSPNVLRYYVLIHDSLEEQGAKAEAVYQSMKSTYGVNNVHLLHINSRNPTTPDTAELGNMPDPWSQFLPRKQDNNTFLTTRLTLFVDTMSFDQSSMQDSSGFPSHVQEGQSAPSTLSQSDSMLSLDGVDPAYEVTEGDQEEEPPPGGQTMKHPLAPDIASEQTDNLSATDGRNFDGVAINCFQISNRTMNSDPVIIRDNQNNPVIDCITMETRGKCQAHGAYLSMSDHDRLRIFINEFIVRGLIPWAERTLRTLNDQVTSRKGIHRSFLNIGKKWWGNKPINQSPATERSSVIYTPEAPEMQMRRLADLAFMFQLYEMAYQTYHACKKDFNSEHAWLHFAGALEMACMSVFMQGSNSQRQYPHHYMETAITTYLNTCKNHQFASRATLLSTEALKSKMLYTEAALLFIKMTSEDSDLRSALLLEQAAHCFLNMKQPMVRKYAFHMILAGHRFSKAGQRRHALRSYSQALQVYRGKDWSLAEDHINFTLGRQSFNLKQLENSTAAFKHLLTESSKQSQPQQNAFLREYLFVFKQQLNQYLPDGSTSGVISGELPQLPLPAIKGNLTKVLVTSTVLSDNKVTGLQGVRTRASYIDFTSDEVDSAIWHKLEELIMVADHGSIPSYFRHSTYCYTERTNNLQNPICVLDEPVHFEVVLSNPMKVPLLLQDLSLLWKFLPSDPDKPTQPIITNEAGMSDKLTNSSEYVTTQVIPEIVLPGGETKPIQLALTCHVTGELHATGIAYSLGTNTPDQVAAPSASDPANISKPSFTAAITIRGKATLEVQGQRLNNTKEDRMNQLYGPDRRLDLIVVPKMPKLQVEFTDFPQSLLCCEVRQISVEFTNTGAHPVSSVCVACTFPEFFTLGLSESSPSAREHCIYPTLINSSESDSEEYVVNCPNVKFVHKVTLPGGELEPGKTVSLPLWLRGLPTAGKHSIHFLFLYKSSLHNPKLRHRVVHHRAEITFHQSLALRASAVRSHDNIGQSETSKDHSSQSIAVSLEVENMNNVQDSSITEFSVLQVSCVSSHWHLQHLSTQRHSDIKITSMQSSLLCFRAQSSKTRCQTLASGSQQRIFTNVTFDQHQIDSSAPPCADFYARCHNAVKFADVRSEMPRSNLGLDHSDSVEELSPYLDLEQAISLDLILIILWKAFMVDEHGTSHAIQGQHHITLEELNTPVHAPLYNKVSFEQGLTRIVRVHEDAPTPVVRPIVTSQLVKYQLYYSKDIAHDYSRKRLCSVPVILTLLNCCATPLEVQITLPKHVEPSTLPSDLINQSEVSNLVLPPPPSQSEGSFVWSGRGITSLTLKADASFSHTLYAVFNKPGVYDLRDLVVTAKVNAIYTRQKPQGSYLLVVKGKSVKGDDSKIA